MRPALNSSKFASLLACAALVVTACSQAAGANVAGATSGATSAATMAASAAPQAQSAGGYYGGVYGSDRYGGGSATSTPMAAAAPAIALGSGALGSFLTGANGMTLYVYAKDTADKSTCTGQCAAAWPPVTVPAGTKIAAPAGVMGAFGAITRADGTTQLTYNHRPLYYFTGDSAAGQTNGQGIGGVWAVAKP